MFFEKLKSHFSIDLISDLYINLKFAIQGGQDGELNSSEDCLFVQITTRKWLMMNRETDKKPYVQYIHGGAFNFGSGSDQGPAFLVIS